MKHLLPILTAALVCMGAYTASAQSTTPESPAFTYEVVRTGYDKDHLPSTNDHRDSFFKIRVTSGTGDIYFSDWIDNIGDSHQEDNLTNKGIESYGYRYVKSNDTSKINSEKIYTMGKDAVITHDAPVKSPWNNNQITRYNYLLGTFTEGDEIEIYMQDKNGEVWSNTTKNMGAWGDGIDNADVLAMYQIAGSANTMWGAEYVAAAKKAMPLTALDTGNGHRVFFIIPGAKDGGGVRGGTVGSPLPGGVQIALIAGFFGLGFWYFRRRKAIAA